MFISCVSTITGTPAEDAGLQSEDVIAEIDGETVLGMSTAEIAKRIQISEFGLYFALEEKLGNNLKWIELS